MKIALFSDLHAHPFAQYARMLPNGRNGRLQDALDAMGAVRRAALAAKVGAVVFGGDLFHTFSRLDVAALNGVHEEIVRFGEDRLVLFLLVGNHDLADKSGRHALEIFKALGHVVVMDAPGWYYHPKVPKLGIYAVPYREDTNEVRALLGAIPPPPGAYAHRLLLLHVGFDGAKTGPHEYRMSSELSVGDVPDGFDFVLSGHYHLPQWLDQGRRIAYIGATTHQTWGDVNQPRGYAIADLKRLTLERCESGAPRFLRVTREELPTVRAGDFVEVVLPHDADDTVLADAREALATTEAGGGQVVLGPAPEAAPLARLGCGTTTDVAALVAPYVKHVTDETAPREALVALGHDFLRRAAG